MKKLRILSAVLKKTKADKIVLGFVIFLLVSALIILLVEPDITRYGDALWYCYAVFSTIGFGDIVATAFITKVLSVLITVYALFAIAVVTGVVVSFYNSCVEQQFKETKSAFLDKLQRLPQLSKEELEEIAEKAKKWK
ncbi:MAG: two pore domain potassium channel family protein [Clostridia bacterium]|nr:two pore domain potassium channel family protein [Clostridia bacterium]